MATNAAVGVVAALAARLDEEERAICERLEGAGAMSAEAAVPLDAADSYRSQALADLKRDGIVKTAPGGLWLDAQALASRNEARQHLARPLLIWGLLGALALLLALVVLFGN